VGLYGRHCLFFARGVWMVGVCGGGGWEEGGGGVGGLGGWF